MNIEKSSGRKETDFHTIELTKESLSARAKKTLTPENKNWIRWQLWERLDEKGFDLQDVLNRNQEKVLSSYLPAPHRSLVSQEKVANEILGENLSSIKSIIVYSLFRVDRRYCFGPRAIEQTMKPISKFLYKGLVRSGVTTVDEVVELSLDNLRKITGARPMMNELINEVQRYYGDWNPEVKFRQDLDPSEAWDLE